MTAFTQGPLTKHSQGRCTEINRESQHTQGRLNYAYPEKNDGVIYFSLVVPYQPGQVVAVARSVLEPDARRLAACWNACEGLPTDRLESELIENTLSCNAGEIYELRAQLDAARAMLSAVMKKSDDDIAAIEKAGGLVDAPPLAERIRMFLKGSES
ncbi:hypothetical protein BjapCC829_28640 [Bradyrhizobium barranii]|uniref:Uncharacterized protein n=1 Tax=Bradyrhizobium barranii TaxID=2992140 RepID=A0ABY3QDH5_9BRAD|nr:hypothetical protein [Bradyrhizobium japonicum]UFW83910.1 hypothetical protein BjapCC829_28640 [Bradyrhizobium japonicum]